MSSNTQDRWAQWLLHRRFGGDPQRGQAMLETLSFWRDQILEHATITKGETVLAKSIVLPPLTEANMRYVLRSY